MTKLRLVAVMRLSSKAQIRGHGKERQEEDEIKDYVDELDACRSEERRVGKACRSRCSPDH